MTAEAAPRASTAAFDFTALTDHPSPEAVRAFADSVRQTVGGARRRRLMRRSIALVVGLSLVALFCASIIWVIIEYTIANQLASGLVIGVAIGVAFLGFLIFGCIHIMVSDASFSANWNRVFRLFRFAKANELTFTWQAVGPSLAGSIFTLGKRGVAYEVMSVKNARPVQFGNYRRDGASLSNLGRWQWGFLQIKLDRRLPHMILEARRNRSPFTNRVGDDLVKRQALSLEGDFNRYFTLYAPREYERDALYVFAPDLMALLIDRVSAFDVEIVDDWLFVYSHKPWDLLKPETHVRLAEIVQTVANKTVRQTERYADARVGNPNANVVAPGGRRLARGFSTIAIVVLAVYWILRALMSIHGN